MLSSSSSQPLKPFQPGKSTPGTKIIYASWLLIPLSHSHILRNVSAFTFF